MLSQEQIQEVIDIIMVRNFRAYQLWMTEFMADGPTVEKIIAVNSVSGGMIFAEMMQYREQLTEEEFGNFLKEVMIFSLKCIEWYTETYHDIYVEHVHQIDPNADPNQAVQELRQVVEWMVEDD